MLDADAAALARVRVNMLALPAAKGLEIRFLQANALRFRPDRAYDLIWCSGLLDYLSDRAAIYLLARLRQALTERGLICVGNFGSSNPSRPYMEVIANGS